MEEKVYRITSPLTIQYGWDRGGKAKTFSLNLNIYRNFNKFALGTAKKAYADLMFEPVSKLPPFKRISIRYVLFTGSNRKVDLMNIISIVDKFFCDCLVIQNKIPDDNYSILPKLQCEFGGVDKSNPRVEIYIKELT